MVPLLQFESPKSCLNFFLTNSGYVLFKQQPQLHHVIELHIRPSECKVKRKYVIATEFRP